MSIDSEQAAREDLKEITPPEGVVMYRQTSDEKGDPVEHFGLQRCMVGDIGQETDVEEGTLLRFGPGRIRIGVARQDLSADDINRVGQLGLDVLEAHYYRGATGREVELIEKIKSEVPAPLLMGGRVLKSQIEEKLGDFGAFADSLRTSRKEQGAKFDELVDTLDSMDVRYIHTGPSSGITMKAELKARAKGEFR